jgi:hypothetical protein
MYFSKYFLNIPITQVGPYVFPQVVLSWLLYKPCVAPYVGFWLPFRQAYVAFSSLDSFLSDFLVSINLGNPLHRFFAIF